MNIAAQVERAATTFGDRPAVGVGGDVVADYRTLRTRCSLVGHGLAATHGLAPGDRVAIFMGNSASYVEVLVGIWYAGLAAVPVNAKLHANECAYVIEHSGARLCITDADHLDSARRAAEPTGAAVLCVDDDAYGRLVTESAGGPLVPRDPTDLAWLFYTSGTTGRPKGAMLSHRNLLMMGLSYHADVDALGPDDVLVHAAPMSHGSGLYLVPLLGAAGCNVIPTSGGFDTGEILELLDQWSSCSFFMAPTMIHRMLEEHRITPDRVAGLRTIVYGGGPMYLEDLHRGLDAFGPKLAQIYGQGESPMTITGLPKSFHDRSHPRSEQRLRSTGFARTGVEVSVVDGDDRPLPTGEVGEIVVRGDVVMTGYWQNPEATAETLRGGWLHTGDLGFLDDEGFLTLQDRSKDLIISGGTNIYPREVEEVLLAHPGVAEVSVVGRPHPEWGEEVVAFVVPDPGAPDAPTVAALDAFCLDQIARFKRPKDYRFVDALPKNNYGKVLKTELRTML